MIAVAVVLPSDIDRDMIKLWDARLNQDMGCQAEHPMPDLFSTGNGPRCFTAATKTKCHDRRVALCCRSS
jgi:hypothetical protein